MKLDNLLAVLPDHQLLGRPPAGELSGLACDSRRVTAGGLFAALPGASADGHDFIPAALEAGAACLLVERVASGVGDICQVVVPDARRALALMAARWFGEPTRSMVTVGVTGTNGKTTVSHLIASVLAVRGPVGLIGTVRVRFADVDRPAAMTTPEPLELQALFSQMLGKGVDQAVMEISSHALVQHRADGVALDLGVFTNLSRDHLDYHGDLASYYEAKRLLFTRLLPEAAAMGKHPKAVICLDDPRGEDLARAAAERGIEVWTYALDHPAMVRAEDIILGLDGGVCRVVWPGGDFLAATPLVGRYNIQNLLGAAAAGLALGMKGADVGSGLADLNGVPGRLERVPSPAAGSPAVFVDYAHSDDALRNALGTLKPLTTGRLFCVFGAGGDRDHGKRPLMGRAVGELADLAVLTSDNPRTEDPEAIMDMIQPGLVEAGSRLANRLTDAHPPAFVREPDRGRAIERAIMAAGAGDVVVIAGKGHEDYQVIGGEKRHFDDREQAGLALAKRAARERSRG
ncbi:MAG: UDP-N-acetylmuramoyl-L-alanyl-D-glutamate--2,6-diaminopimelate ligase [Desulfarculus sp.]|nr:UDP-N-acetylmuramoyl-L-alanyl-D-glutamate--2,6-diaminopimelate ligase [Desulfarculus sp.]